MTHFGVVIRYFFPSPFWYFLSVVFIISYLLGSFCFGPEAELTCWLLPIAHTNSHEVNFIPIKDTPKFLKVVLLV